MDKLAMWQLLRSIGDHGINPSSNDKAKDDRDWMQIFCEDVVQEMFVHSQHFTRSLQCADIHLGVQGSASYSQICVTCCTEKCSDTPCFLMTRTRKHPHRVTRNESRNVKKPYQPRRPVLENRPSVELPPHLPPIPAPALFTYTSTPTPDRRSHDPARCQYPLKPKQKLQRMARNGC